jgi:hypothetical protein
LNAQMERQVKGVSDWLIAIVANVGDPLEKDERLPNLAGISGQNICPKRNLEVALHRIELHCKSLMQTGAWTNPAPANALTPDAMQYSAE